eukprot:TRINITY_DN1178_c0_g1_i1.p1 TRINITY_DN1178_c0_g1~~TRINITY_DN1178_c0_g1_i1.p1  ORF type:complete len:365 (+),score=31.49 TRINITY_DN1178_c0_g1_i1:728-1822(+)
MKMSNRIMCYRNAVLHAGLLNRTLLINTNTSEIHARYNRSLVFDLNHLQSCYGADVVMTHEEFRKKYNADPMVDQVLCFPSTFGCPDHMEEKNKWFLMQGQKTFPVEWAHVHGRYAHPLKRVNKSRDLTVSQVLEEAPNAVGRVLWVGENHHTRLAGDKLYPRRCPKSEVFCAYQGGEAPFQRLSTCPRGFVIKPDGGMFSAANSFVAEELGGGPFLAAHVRRGDFVRNRTPLPLDEALEWIRRLAGEYELMTVFLATDADLSELAHIRKSFQAWQLELPRLRLVTLHVPKRHHTAVDVVKSRWLQEVYDRGWEGELPVMILDKVICSMASAFLGSIGSTFTDDIMRLRYGMATASARDRLLGK